MSFQTGNDGKYQWATLWPSWAVDDPEAVFWVRLFQFEKAIRTVYEYEGPIAMSASPIQNSQGKVAVRVLAWNPEAGTL